MNKLLFLGTLLLCLSNSAKSNAAERNDIPSCYQHADVMEHAPTGLKRELFIAIDQTTRLDDEMRKNVHRQLNNFGQPGDRITITTFSAVADNYTKVAFTGLFEKLPEKSVSDSMNALKLKRLKRCVANQKNALMSAHVSLKDSFGKLDENYPNTELVGALSDIGNGLVSRSAAERKIVLVVSDMLENSSALTFYSKGKVRLQSAEKAYSAIQKANIQTNFGNADVHVIGAGYRLGKVQANHHSMTQIEKFWTRLFQDSNANMVQFGKPNLLTAVN
ncbi:hypothetical protein [Vibrio owensii]|uniref:hypothetical protein n=1 Tax=Vibrio owensii TaxID=696485 RepID=UPI0018F15A4B|nr:hypothetical protein [Vibrio owensii]